MVTGRRGSRPLHWFFYNRPKNRNSPPTKNSAAHLTTDGGHGDLRILQRVIAGAEEQGDAPHARQSDHGIDDTGDHGGGSAAHPRNEIKLEQTDAAPVQGADDGNDQRNAIQDHHVRNLSFPKGTGSTASIYSHVCGWRTSAADGYTPALTPSVGSPFCPNVCSSNHSVARRNAFYVPTQRDIFPFLQKIPSYPEKIPVFLLQSGGKCAILYSV